MQVKGNHPLAEIIVKKLFGIQTVPIKYMEKMINSACKEAVNYHNQILNNYIQDLEVIYQNAHTILPDIQAGLNKDEILECLSILIFKYKEKNNV